VTTSLTDRRVTNFLFDQPFRDTQARTTPKVRKAAIIKVNMLISPADI